jgi:EmrB/QacA subfamily drug resistance transporter
MSEQVAVLIATGIAAFLTPFMSAAVTIALPTIGLEMGAETTLLNWVATSFLLAAAMSLVPLGKLADIHGRRRMFTAGMIVHTLASLACAAAPTIEALIVLRAVQGVGGAMIFGTSTALLTSVFPPGARGRVLGVNIGLVYVGLSTGPFLGGLMTHWFGWRSLFLLGAGLGVAGLVVVLAGIRSEWAEAKGDPFDVAGAVIYATGLAVLMTGLSLLPGPAGVACIVGGLAFLAAFVRHELRIAHPVLDLSLFVGNPIFAWSNLAALINYSATFAVTFLLSLYLQYVRGMTPRDAGLLMVVQPVLQAAFSPLAGRLSDRLQPRLLASSGMFLSIVGLVPLTFLDASTHLGVVAASLAIMGLGFALFSSPNTNAIMGAVPRRSYGVASATLATMRLVGQMLSMGMVMVAFALTMGHTKITPDLFPQFLDALHAVFMGGIALCGVGVFASLARGKVRQP